MRDTEGDPCGRRWLGGCLACRVFASRVVEALGDELGELLHPRGEDSRDDAVTRASTSSPRTRAPTRGCTEVAGCWLFAASCWLTLGVATPRVPQDAIRTPANPTARRRFRLRPSAFCLPVSLRLSLSLLLSLNHPPTPFDRSPFLHHRRKLATARKPRLISICARFSTRFSARQAQTTTYRCPRRVALLSRLLLSSPL